MRRPPAAITAATLALVLATAGGGFVSPAAAGEAPVIETLTVPDLDAWTVSPDGTLVAGVHGDARAPDEWCLHELPSGTERWCIDAAPGGDPLAIGPVWLPDGSAFVATESPLREPDIWRIDAATGEATNLTDDGYAGRWKALRPTIGAGDPPLHLDVFPVVSPDGTSVAFLRSTTTDTTESATSLQLVPVAGGPARELTVLPTMPSRWPAWSKDGQWVHWVEDGDRGGDVIGSVAPDGTRGRRIHLSDPDGGGLLPSRIRATLADGRLLMDASCELFGDCHTWLVDPVTGIAETLLAESEDDPTLTILGVAGSRDGHRVAALVRRGETIVLDVIDPGTRETRSIPLPDAEPTRWVGVRWLTDDRILVGGDEHHPRDHLVVTVPGSAASPTPGSGLGSDPVRELVVEIEMLAPCPSVLGCTHHLELQGPRGPIELPIALDGADRTEARPARFALAAGPTRLSVATRMTAELLEGASEEGTTTFGLASCAVDLVIPEDAGTFTVRGWVTFAPSPAGGEATPDADDTGWRCRLSGLDQPPGVPPAPSVVAPIGAVACSLSQVGWDEQCAWAVKAALPVRPPFRVAPLAVASPDCPGRERCEIARFAVAFATREGDAWSWSETLRVTVAPGGAVVVPWPADRPLPRRFPALQKRHNIGGRLGEVVGIPTSDPVPEGQTPVCLTAELPGTVLAHPEWGVALVGTDGLHRVTWPAGWTARRAPEGVVLVDAAGETVAREGQAIRLGGGETAPGEWVTCGDIAPPMQN